MDEDIIIARSDEFTILEDSRGFASIIDGKNRLRLLMPMEILMDLATQLTSNQTGT